MATTLEALEARLAAGDSLGLTLAERDALSERIRHVRALRAAEDLERGARLLRFERTGDQAKTTPEAGDLRDKLEELGGHLDAALRASLDGYHRKSRRCMRNAQAAHKEMVGLLGDDAK